MKSLEAVTSPTIPKWSYMNIKTNPTKLIVDEKDDTKWMERWGVIKKVMPLAQIVGVFISPAIQFYFLSYLMGPDNITVSNHEYKSKRLLSLGLLVQKRLNTTFLKRLIKNHFYQ